LIIVYRAERVRLGQRFLAFPGLIRMLPFLDMVYGLNRHSKVNRLLARELDAIDVDGDLALMLGGGSLFRSECEVPALTRIETAPVR
jgi:hypothetical protein